MNTATPLLIALGIVAASQAAAAEPCTPLPSSAAIRSAPSFTKESATVEDVLSTAQDGFRSRAYIVTWHDTQVLVSDPLAESNKAVGDSIDFMAYRIAAVTGLRVLMFTVPQRASHRTAGASTASSMSASSMTGTGVVEEVLRAEDNGFRFIAYIVASQGQRIAVSDPLALSHHGIGEQIDYVASKVAAPGGQLLDFDVRLSAADRASISGPPLCGMQRSLEMGVIDQVLSTEADGYEYRAYVVDWRGSQIVIEDPTAAASYQVGENVSFWVTRFQLPAPGGYRSQSFRFDQPPQGTVINQASNLQSSISMDSAHIQTVLVSDEDGYKSVVYLVNWHDTPIAVVDPFATTRFAVGDLIHFSVDQTATPYGKGLSFMLGLQPRPCVKPPSSGADSAPVAASKAPSGGCRS